MADKASDGLPYGQLGRARYNLETKEWQSGRLANDYCILRPVTAPSVISEAAAKDTTDFESLHDRKDSRTRRREKQINSLVSACPELQPASDLLPELARLSEAVLNAEAQSNDNRSQLIALGEIYDESRRRHVAALAFPCGPTGGDVRIVEGLRHLEGWDDDPSSGVETFRFVGDEAVWEGPGVGIRSIIFAQPLERGERYLAVRLHTETLVFRPVLRKHARPGQSRLDMDLLYSIGIHGTGHTSHADIAFNPWFTGQLAIIDQGGRWSLWETGRKSRDAKKIKSCTPISKPQTKDKQILDDGWNRVTWCESASTLCVATRRSLSLIDLDVKDELEPLPIELNLKGGIGWILDLAWLSELASHLFVLTSSHINIYRIGRTSEGELVARKILQVRHHRSPEDVTLSMRLCLSQNDIVLILRSALGPVVTQCRYRLSEPDLVQVQLPTEFGLPKRLQASRVLDFRIEPVRGPSKDDSSIDSAEDRELCHFYSLSKDMQLTQSVYISVNGTGQEDLIGKPSWVKDLTKPRHSLKADLGGFLVDDDRDEMAVECRPPTSDYVRRRRDQSDTARRGADWTLNSEHVAQQLSELDAGQLTDIEEVIEEASTRLQKPVDQSERPMQSLYDVAGGSVDVKDAEGASARLVNFQTTEAEQVTIAREDDGADDNSQTRLLTAALLASPTTQNLLGLGGLDDLRTALDNITQQWPSSSGWSSATTASRASIARQMAADVTLASQVLRVKGRQPDEPAQSQSQSQIWDLPVRPPPVEEWSEDAKLSYYPSSSRGQTPTLPTPSASAPASTITSSSHPTNTTAPEISRLSKYMTFTKDPPSRPPRTLNRVLSHWPLAADPAEYDWQHTSRHLTRRDEEEAAAEGEGMTEKERRAMERRTERHLRRQRREAEESQRQQWLSSQAPEIVSASQPARGQALGMRMGVESQGSAGAPPVVMGSSQSFDVGGGQQMAASQVVPGRHGGRPPAKKKRKSGF